MTVTDIHEWKRRQKVPEDLKRDFKGLAARMTANEDQLINGLLPLLHQSASYKGDATKVRAIEKRLGMEISQVCSIKSVADATDEQRARLLAYAISADVYDLVGILAEIEPSNED